VWVLYKQLTDGKPLKDATRDDGRKVVQHFESQGLRSATIQKKITQLLFRLLAATPLIHWSLRQPPERLFR
jgi:hypothetical protein